MYVSVIIMREEQEPKRKNYNYHYVSFSASLKEKEIVHEAMKRENFKTISDFIRRIVFNHIRKQENPELFLGNGTDSATTLMLEKIAASVTELQRNQETLLEHKHAIQNLQDGVKEIKYLLQLNNLAEERKKIIEILEKHTSLSFEQIKQMTGLPERIITQIIFDNKIFKSTESGRVALA